ncbi:MAG: MFS transporter [SAR324 cluster bacterium]|nr:MFS transporter [SAR324 cluster bacterium]
MTSPQTNTYISILLLSICFSLSASTSSLSVSASSIVGFQIAENKALATFPLTFHLLGTMLAGIPASMLMKFIGRRYGFLIGTGIGTFGAASASLAIIYSSFPFFCLSIFCLGILNGFAQLYRFTAVEVSSIELRTKAVSYVMLGGIAAGFIGPAIAAEGKDYIENAQFAGSYLSIILLYFFIVIILMRIRLPQPSVEEQTGDTRPLKVIFMQPKFIVSVLSAMIGYGVMAMIMTATPLAMTKGNGYPFSDAAFIIQWHALGMFAPSFITGSLIKRFGAVQIIFTGIFLNFICIAINISGTEIINYWSALVLLGVGWNFMFVAGTTMVTETYQPAEKAIVQGVNDFLVFGTAALCSLLSGVLQTSFGWETVNLSAIPLLLIVLVSLFWFIFSSKQQAQTA